MITVFCGVKTIRLLVVDSVAMFCLTRSAYKAVLSTARAGRMTRRQSETKT